MSPPRPNILDVTVRDGSYLINHQYTPEMVANIAKGLEAAGMEYAEISHGLGIGAKLMGHPARVDDEALMEAAKKAAPNLKISAFISPMEYSLPLIPGLVDFFDIGRVGANIDNLRITDKIIAKLKKYNKTVSMQLVRTHARPPKFVGEAVKGLKDLGIDIFYVVDSFGSMKPEDVKEYVTVVKENTDAQVGFHGHNNIKMAIPNTIAAWKTGATWLDASLMGVGRAAGNANLEVLVHLLNREGLLTSVDPGKLCETTEKVIIPIFKYPPVLTLVDFLLSLERLDFSQQEFLPVLASYLHIPLEEFLSSLHNLMKEDIILDYGHIKALFQGAGHDLDKLVESLGIQKH